jgi:peptidoglycan/LPS O-acetylase OafA/YrhL
MNIARKHFHTFDALRFFSFLLVFFHHVPTKPDGIISFFSKSGGIGVSFFFVLSGFLISYILMHEKISFEKISLKKFMMRRILRIWPLYYAMLLFAFATPYLLNYFNIAYSNEGYEPNWLISATFLENYKIMATNSFPNTSPLRVMWSICVEEHFYIIWGLAFYWLPLKKVPQMIGGFILLGTVCRLVYHSMGIASLDVFSNIDYFAYGAIPAYLLHFKPAQIEKFGRIKKGWKYGFALFTLALVFCIPNQSQNWIELLAPSVLGMTFSVLILITLPQQNALYISTSSVLSKLGIFTYALYLIHTIVINLMLKIDQMIFDQYNWLFTATISLAITIIASIASYHLFEKHFLKLKKYFY